MNFSILNAKYAIEAAPYRITLWVMWKRTLNRKVVDYAKSLRGINDIHCTLVLF